MRSCEGCESKNGFHRPMGISKYENTLHYNCNYLLMKPLSWSWGGRILQMVEVHLRRRQGGRRRWCGRGRLQGRQQRKRASSRISIGYLIWSIVLVMIMTWTLFLSPSWPPPDMDLLTTGAGGSVCGLWSLRMEDTSGRSNILFPVSAVFFIKFFSYSILVHFSRWTDHIVAR